MTTPRGFIIYRGASLIDGAPIVAVAITARSRNEKTGNMVQTYILADNGERPSANVQTGADVSICGDCKHRPANGGACYVVVAQGPTAVFKSLMAGKYPRITSDRDIAALGVGRVVRLGTYGDPAAVPSSVWAALVSHAAGRTGYTHQWRNLRGASVLDYQRLVMASADTPDELAEAQAQGWRTFRVRLETEALAPRESVCPASAEAGKKVTCAQCRMCDGTASGKRGSIAIYAHGGKASRYIGIRASA